MTGFTLPGSDTCLQISGRVTYDYYNSDFDDTDTFYDGRTAGEDGGAGYRINLDARSNTDLGVVRSFISLTNGTDEVAYGSDGTKTYARKAFIQVGGFTAGLKDSIADIAGTQGEIFASGWSQSGLGVDYVVNVNGLTLGVAADDNLDPNDDSYSERPDLILHLSGKAGDFGFKMAAVSADHDGESGYALLGHLNASMGNVTAFAFAGISDSAPDYTWADGGTCETDENAEGMSYGGGLTFKVGAATSITAQARHAECEDDDSSLQENDSFGFVVQHQLAKNLSIEPEYVYSVDQNDNDNSEFFVRIKRDF